MAMHRINRSEVELHTGDAALARALLDQISRIYGSRIAPVLDRVCSELSASDAPVRIDRLELDLGPLAADDVGDAFVHRLEPALRAALQAALQRRTGGDRGARDSLELLETFAFTGGLPWWAPPDRDVVARHFARASAEAGAELVALLGRLAQAPGALDRIARLCGRSTLAVLVERAQADQRRPAGQRPPSSRGVDDTARRQSADPILPGDQQARAPDIADRELAPSNAPAVDDVMGRASSAASLGTEDPSRRSRRAAPTALDEEGDSTVFSVTQGVISTAEAPGSDGAKYQAHPREAGDRDPALPDLPPLPGAAAVSAPAASQMTGGRSPHARQGGPRPLELPRSPAPPSPEGARRGALARLDELYVEDAGLVILWPFLERFFLRSGVLGEDQRFLDEAAQLQAVALIASLATEDPAPLEFRLPLAKLLCGRPLESDFALERPLAPEQLAEGDRLLAAVIDRVPALGEPSIPEFRAGFLARPGALGARDGAWLLQVERRPHDSVLDRFPWSWRWVRLPWMPGPLRVEW